VCCATQQLQQRLRALQHGLPLLGAQPAHAGPQAQHQEQRQGGQVEAVLRVVQEDTHIAAAAALVRKLAAAARALRVLLRLPAQRAGNGRLCAGIV
jgi:hypothetical protein